MFQSIDLHVQCNTDFYYSTRNQKKIIINCNLQLFDIFERTKQTIILNIKIKKNNILIIKMYWYIVFKKHCYDGI